MRNLKHATVGVFAGGLLSFVTLGFATAQVDSTVRLDIGTVAQELELSEETSRQLAPLLDQLDAVLQRRQEHRQQADAIQEEFADTYEQIAETLSAAELRDFHLLLRETAIGPRAGRPMGQFYRDGRMRGGANRWPAMRGGRGNFGRGTPMRGTRGYRGQREPMRGLRGCAAWDTRPGWRPNGFDQKD
jgi:hypothetical protein